MGVPTRDCHHRHRSLLLPLLVGGSVVVCPLLQVHIMSVFVFVTILMTRLDAFDVLGTSSGGLFCYLSASVGSSWDLLGSSSGGREHLGGPRAISGRPWRVLGRSRVIPGSL